MQFFPPYGEWQLDIVGIVAILGEGSISRNSQASGCSWFHILPRLMPAPQALLKHHQDPRLPTVPGIVVGAYSGRIRTELNFFTRLLHNRDLQDFEVELVEVSKTPGKEDKPPYSVKRYGHLAALSIFGCCLSMLLLGLAAHWGDGSAILATLMLSLTSTTVGLASKWRLEWPGDRPNEQRKGKIPHGDVVIFYPKTGAFRIVRCNEYVSRMYFNDERCKYYFGDNPYRITALLSTILLMAGLIFLGNSTPRLQAIFALSYIVLNALHWSSSALDPTRHVWKHNYTVTRFGNNVPLNYRQPTMPSGVIAIPDDPDPTTNAVNVAFSAANGFEKFTGSVSRIVGLSDLRNRVPTTALLARDTEPSSGGASAPSKVQRTKAAVGSIVLGRAYTSVEPPNLASDLKYRNMTSALWIAIALTGTSAWARSAQIAPDHEVWDQWLDMAARRAAPKWSDTHGMYIAACKEYTVHGGEKCIVLPSFNFQGALKRLFMEYDEVKKQRPIHRETNPPDVWLAAHVAISVAVRLKILLRRARIALEKRDDAAAAHKLQASVLSFQDPKISSVHSNAVDSGSSTS